LLTRVDVTVKHVAAAEIQRKMRNKKMIHAEQRIQREQIRALNNPELRLESPILDSVAQEHCKAYLVDVQCVTSIVINTDGYIRNLSTCLEFVNPPPPTMCPESEPILVASEGGTMFAEDAQPIIITEQTCSTVTFQVVNIFEKNFTSYYVEYHNGGFGANECLQTENVCPRDFPRNKRSQSLQNAKGVNLMRTCAEFFALGLPSCCAVVGLQLRCAKIFDRGKVFDRIDST
jgi:hypothetical protein